MFGTCTLARVGNLVTVWIPGLTGNGVGTNTACTVTIPMPSAFSPTGAQNLIAWVEANGTSQFGGCQVAGTTVTLFPTPFVSGTFTGTLARGLPNGAQLSWL